MYKELLDIALWRVILPLVVALAVCAAVAALFGGF